MQKRMLESLAEDMQTEEAETDPVTPITNMQQAAVISRLEREGVKRRVKTRIGTLLCREIF